MCICLYHTYFLSTPPLRSPALPLNGARFFLYECDLYSTFCLCFATFSHLPGAAPWYLLHAKGFPGSSWRTILSTGFFLIFPRFLPFSALQYNFLFKSHIQHVVNVFLGYYLSFCEMNYHLWLDYTLSR